MSRCDWSDLPVDQCACAHCAPHLVERAEKATVRVTFTARYNSPCDWCDGRIRVDEQMGLDENDNRVCIGCLEEAA